MIIMIIIIIKCDTNNEIRAHARPARAPAHAIAHTHAAEVNRHEAEFYEIDFPLANPETHNIGTKLQQRAHGTEVQNERSVERDFLFVFTATNKKFDLV